MWVDDLIDGFLKLVDSGYKDPINLGNPKEISILSLAKKIIKLTDSKSEIIFLPLPSDDPPRRCPNISKAREILNWEPKTDLDEALLKIIYFFKSKLMS
jgi:nucleoside-diphosphate-sugar epimerase